MKTQAKKISRTKFLLEGKNVIIQPTQTKKKKQKTEEKNSRRESSSSVHRLLIGVGNKFPLALFKEENPPLSSHREISGQNGGNRRKFLTETRRCAVQFLVGKASPATEVSLLLFLSSPPSFPCRCARSSATGVAGFCCERNLYFCHFSDAGGHRRPSIWPSSCRWVTPLLPMAVPRRLHRRPASQ